MKNILKKLTVSRVILTRIIFIALFFTVTIAVPTHKAEAGGGGGGGGGGGTGGGGDGLNMTTHLGDDIGNQDTISGFNNSSSAQSAANDLAANATANDHSGTVYEPSVSRNSDGTYTASTQVSYHGDGGDHYGPAYPLPYGGDVIGEIEFWGHRYLGMPTSTIPYGVECPNGVPSWDPACNSSCTALIGWTYDTITGHLLSTTNVRATDPIKIDIYADGVLYDTISTNPPISGERYRYLTPLAWKDDVTRTITIKATRPSDGLSRFLVHAPTWQGPTSFDVKCHVSPPTIDLTGIITTGDSTSTPDQIKDVPFDIDTIIKNIGTLAAGVSIPVKLQFDRTQDGNSINKTVAGTVRALGINDQVDYTFPNISLPQTGEWRVRLVVDPQGDVEPIGSAYQANNNTPWKSFFVDNPPSTAPTLRLWVLPSNTLTIGADQTYTLGWFGENIKPGTCLASIAWSGNKNNSGSEIFSVGNIPGSKRYLLSCTGTNGDSINDNASVTITDTTPTADITINLWASPSIIRSGERTRLYYDITTHYNATCSATGPGSATNPGGRSDPFHITMDPDHPNESVSISSNFTTAPITNNQRFTITCNPDVSSNGPEVTKSVTVEVIPVAQEV